MPWWKSKNGDKNRPLPLRGVGGSKNSDKKNPSERATNYAPRKGSADAQILYGGWKEGRKQMLQLVEGENANNKRPWQASTPDLGTAELQIKVNCIHKSLSQIGVSSHCRSQLSIVYVPAPHAGLRIICCLNSGHMFTKKYLTMGSNRITAAQSHISAIQFTISHGRDTTWELRFNAASPAKKEGATRATPHARESLRVPTSCYSE